MILELFDGILSHCWSYLHAPVQHHPCSTWLISCWLFTFGGYGGRLLPCAFHWVKISINSNLQIFARWWAWWNSTVSAWRWWTAVLSVPCPTLYESWMWKTSKFLLMYSLTDHSYRLFVLGARYIWSTRHLSSLVYQNCPRPTGFSLPLRTGNSPEEEDELEQRWVRTFIIEWIDVLCRIFEIGDYRWVCWSF